MKIMRKKYVIAIIIIVLLAVVGIIFYSRDKNVPDRPANTGDNSLVTGSRVEVK